MTIKRGRDFLGEAIEELARTRKLRLKRDDGAPDLGEARALVERTISDAHRWAKYYERKLNDAPTVSRSRKTFGHAARKEAIGLREFLGKTTVTDRRAPPENPLSAPFIALMIKDAEALAMRLEKIAEACKRPAPGIQGRPSDGWLLGFIWGMAVGWRNLTTAKITPRGHFPRLLKAALEREVPDRTPDDWETLVKTAIGRFALNRAQWLRPGDDLANFPLQLRQ